LAELMSIVPGPSLLALLLAAAPAASGMPQWSPGVPLAEDFDGVAAPALPYGWVATNVVGPDPKWATDTGNPDTPPNVAFVPDPYPSDGSLPDKRLDSAPVAITTGGAQLWFRHTFSLAQGPCGGSPKPEAPAASAPDGCWEYPTLGRLRISIDGGAFEDITAAGGIFVEGGYTDGAWRATNPGYPAHATVRVDLPPALAGHTVVLEWQVTSRLGLNSGPGEGWRIDSVRICDGYPCFDSPVPVGLDVDTGGNRVLEVGETVDIDPSYENVAHNPIDLTAGIGDYGGPPGTVFTLADTTANFGTIAPLTIAGCVATGDCYSVQLQDPGTRPAQHWDAQLWEDLSTGEVVVWALHVGDSFADVAGPNLFYRDVESVFHRGITGGCGGTSYCPDNSALRKQMAVFLLKSVYGSAYVPPPAAGIFEDVPASDPFAPWVENLYALGVTGGCSSSPLLYCPNEAVLRKQMAVFLLKTANGAGYAPPPCQGTFSDVPCPSPFADWIEDLAARQIAAGCGGGAFCPDQPNTRGQMAVFLVKTFGLTLYGP